MRNVKLGKILFYSIFVGIIASLLYFVVPVIKKEHELNKIRWQIEKIESQIEYNKNQWLNCDTNMKLWNEENEMNRWIVDELKRNYNDMVGFTSAWQPIK